MMFCSQTGVLSMRTPRKVTASRCGASPVLCGPQMLKSISVGFAYSSVPVRLDLGQELAVVEDVLELGIEADRVLGEEAPEVRAGDVVERQPVVGRDRRR